MEIEKEIVNYNVSLLFIIIYIYSLCKIGDVVLSNINDI